MIDYDRLSHANKEIMNSLNSGDTVIPLSEEDASQLYTLLYKCLNAIK